MKSMKLLLTGMLVVAIVVLSVGCPNESSKPEPPPPPKVATPIISGSNFFGSNTVTLTCDTDGADIQYSLKEGTYTAYNNTPFQISTTTTVTTVIAAMEIVVTAENGTTKTYTIAVDATASYVTTDAAIKTALTTTSITKIVLGGTKTFDLGTTDGVNVIARDLAIYGNGNTIKGSRKGYNATNVPSYIFHTQRKLTLDNVKLENNSSTVTWLGTDNSAAAISIQPNGSLIATDCTFTVTGYKKNAYGIYVQNTAGNVSVTDSTFVIAGGTVGGATGMGFAFGTEQALAATTTLVWTGNTVTTSTPVKYIFSQTVGTTAYAKLVVLLKTDEKMRLLGASESKFYLTKKADGSTTASADK